MHHLLEEGTSVTDPKYFQWVNADPILFSGLFDSMKPDAVEYFRYEKTCEAIWDKVNSNLSKKEDDARMYELMIATTQTNQEYRKVQEYAYGLVNLLREMDLCRPPKPNSLDLEYILRDRAFFFLIGLNSEIVFEL